MLFSLSCVSFKYTFGYVRVKLSNYAQEIRMSILLFVKVYWVSLSFHFGPNLYLLHIASHLQLYSSYLRHLNILI